MTVMLQTFCAVVIGGSLLKGCRSYQYAEYMRFLSCTLQKPSTERYAQHAATSCDALPCCNESGPNVVSALSPFVMQHIAGCTRLTRLTHAFAGMRKCALRETGTA